MPEFEIVGRLHDKKPAKKITDKYSIVEIVIAFPANNGKEQLRYMQCVARALEQIDKLNIGDIVKAKVGLRGKFKESAGKYYNLDEVYEIERA
jgi:hypothetical protein